MQGRRTPAPKLVVVIDDDRNILKAMDGLLEGWGYRVVTAESEAAALYALADLGQRPDLIICDHRLAEGRFGFQAIERLRAAFEIPAMVITGECTSGDAEARGYRTLLKPLNPDLLKSTIDGLFARKPSVP